MAEELRSLGSAIDLVVELTGWDWARSESWLDVQVALGAVNPEVHQSCRSFRLSEIEALLTPPAALPARRINRATVRAWLAERYAAGSAPNERADMAAAEKRFLGITRDVVREERRKLLDPEQLRRGPKRNCAEK